MASKKKDKELETDVTETIAEPTEPVADLLTRLHRYAGSIRMSGKQDQVFAVHRTESLLASLKAVLPQTISAVADEDLKTDLEAVLNLL